MLFELEAAKGRVQTSSKRPMKQTCKIGFHAYLLISLLNRIEYAIKLLKLLYLYVESFCRKWRQLAKSNVKTSFPLTM